MFHIVICNVVCGVFLCSSKISYDYILDKKSFYIHARAHTVCVQCVRACVRVFKQVQLDVSRVRNKHFK
jgi:hypothetical protein